MMKSSFARRSFGRSYGLPGGTAVALLMRSTATSQRAEALSPINPGISGAKTIDNGLAIEIRGDGGGGGGGGGGGRGFGGAGFSGVRAGAFHAGPAISGSGGGRPGQIAAGPRFAGHGFRHGFNHRHRRGFFVGGVYYDDYPYDYGYPYYDDPALITLPGCRIVQTIYGPRPVCHRAARHHLHDRRHHHRRHHHA